MGCCRGSSSTSDEGPDPHTFFFKKRGCTDVFCLILFLAFWALIVYFTYVAMTVGDPYAVLYGKDYLGNRCGRGDMADKPAVYYPRIDKDIIAQADVAYSRPWMLNLYGLCMAACPAVTTPEACFANPDSCKVYDYGSPYQYTAAGGQASYYATMPSLNIINRCIPNDESSVQQQADRCAFPQCDGVNYAPCDETYNTTWIPSYPQSLDCEVWFKVGEIKKMSAAGVSAATEAIGGNVASAQRVIMSIVDAGSEILVFGVAFPIVLGFAWLFLLRLFAGTFTYIMILGIGFGLICLSLYCWIRAGVAQELLDKLQDNTTMATAINLTSNQTAALSNTLALALGAVSDGSDAIAAVAPTGLTELSAESEGEVPALWWVLAVIVSILTIIYLISMCAARKKIRTAIALVKEGSSVVRDRPMMMLFPFNTMLVQLGVAAYFLFLVLFLRTADLTMEHFTALGDAVKAGSTYLEEMQFYNSTSSDELADLDESTTTLNILLGLYLLFGFLWTLESVKNIGWTALSGATSHWYFFREDTEAFTKIPITRSLGRVLRFHLGSIFFGSFIVAVIQLIRILLMALDKFTKKQQNANLALKLLIKCTQCCMWCLEKTLKFITNYCWIYVAMQGSGFCKACFLTFSLILSNPAQLAINTFVRTILSWVQLLGLPVLCAWGINVWLTQSDVTETIAPTVVTAITAYLIAKSFSTVFSCILDTLFVCCCRDKAEYKGKFMPNRLKTVFGFKKDKKKKDKEAAEPAEGS